MEKKLATARTVAVLLAILLVIAIVIIVTNHQTIKKLQSPAQQNITAQRDIIREDCTATDPASVERCGQDLKTLSDLLAQFSKNRYSATSTNPVQTSGVSNIQIDKLPKQ